MSEQLQIVMPEQQNIRLPRKQKMQLSEEQRLFIQEVKTGKNVLVDACIGSGKTTAIQYLCEDLPQKHILYLTYNKLLKIDAKTKIKNENVLVTNYHGFAYLALKKIGKSAGISDLIQKFNTEQPPIESYDLLLLDEYQDIEQELADMLLYIKAVNPNIQIVAVGDMEQKIYDKTTLNVLDFIRGFLGDYKKIEFTRCFRLSSELAARLGRIWGKKIYGVNDSCVVEDMNKQQVVEFLAGQEPKNILCLGRRIGGLVAVLNELETIYPEKFNKKTVFASIRDNDSNGVEPKKSSAIFTTYDSSKGLERPVCVIFDFTEDYWNSRINHPQVSYFILRNIFCVAASRGKERIIFVREEDSEKLSEKTLSTLVESKCNFKDVFISEMFEFKYKENVEECFRKLQIKPVTLTDDHSVIQIKERDNLIDLSPCVGNYQEAVFFKNYDIDAVIKSATKESPDLARMTFEQKILYLTSIETKQKRYNTQVTPPIVTGEERRRIETRLNEVVSRDETVQCVCDIPFSDKENGATIFYANGRADVVKDDVVYELKFVNDLMHEHYLQCACYIAALGLKKGILWNVKKNEAYEITIPDKRSFLNAVTKTITKGAIHEYHSPFKPAHKRLAAIIDTETNWDNRVMSIGVVIFDGDTFASEAQKYYIITPEYKRGGIYQSALHIDTEEKVRDRSTVIEEIKLLFQQYHIQCIFAYNAASDCILLPEFFGFRWYDVMKVAAYRQYNKTLPQDALYCTTGRLKSNYGLEALLRLQDGSYQEKHNALSDALDTLLLMKQTGVLLEMYYKVSAIQPRSSVNNCNKKSIDNNRFYRLPRENRESNTSVDLSKENPKNVSDTVGKQVTKVKKDTWELQNVSRGRQRRSEKQGCYIATAVYGDYNCPEVWTLRRYRDCYLKTTWIGRVFISIYYSISPILVNCFGNKKWFNKLWKKRLDRLVYKLNKKGYSSEPYSDVAAEISDRL